jgi:hypothetical protein
VAAFFYFRIPIRCVRKISGAALARFDRTAQARLRGWPVAPMSRPHVQPFLGFHFHPAVEYAAAREYERVRAVIIDDGQLKVAVERSGGNLLPHRASLAAESTSALT